MSSPDDIQIGRQDYRGIVVKEIYAKESSFAIYRSEKDNGPQVQFSGNETERALQQTAYSPIAPLVVEIAALLNQWRGYMVGRAQQQMASAIQSALSGNAPLAREILEAVKIQVVAERQLRGRSWTLAFSMATAAVLALAFCSIARFQSGIVFLSADTKVFQPLPQWVSIALAGMVGALFSSTIAVREKSTTVNLNRLENFVDGGTRVLVGTISAIALYIFIRAGFAPSIKIGDHSLSPDNIENLDISILLSIGFLAGFLERMVPDLIAKK
ncbi:hypothetical protein ACMX25_36500 [Caballeronia sp. 15715]|uniref:hypothetical protein n=1 Tax=Caballeronia sp. 15715 TaxID=3391030 RepID=UPI0039E6C96D